MDEPTPSRKLTAILAADVAGYSRMMRADQSGTVARLAACRKILDEAVALHQGRIANTAGDSVLAEFSSVVDALHCAIEIQAALARENEPLPRESRMQFRIGVHTGEIRPARRSLGRRRKRRCTPSILGAAERHLRLGNRAGAGPRHAHASLRRSR